MIRFVLTLLILSLANGTYAEVDNTNTWAYQLQNADPILISGNNTFDLIVMDQSITGGTDGYYSPAEISSIKDSGKLPICYLSIGEAEIYRGYWLPEWNTNPPSWLGPENPDWPGNYKVRFWDPQWQAIIFENIRTICAQGFSGIYLDIIDGYWYWSELNPENPQADRDMANFVIAIGDSLRAHGGNQQLLIPQNGEYIVVEDDVEGALATEYLATIDAIGIEDVFFFGGLDENNPWNPDNGRLEILADYRQAGITVFSIEYLTDPLLIQQYRQAASGADFIPYTSVRALDILTDGIAVSSSPGPSDQPPPMAVTTAVQTADQWTFRIHSESVETFHIGVFDLRGRRLASETGNLSSGWNNITLPKGKRSSSGLYLYRVSNSQGYSTTGKILLVQ